MKLIINNEEIEILENEISVQELLQLRNIPLQGTAVAVNDMIIGKNIRSSYFVKDGDRITIITAAYGG